MKKIIYWILLITNLSFSQKNIIVEYNVKIENEDIFKNNADLRKLMNNAIQNSKSLKFILNCNENESYFFSKNYLTTEDKLLTNSDLIFAGYLGEIYQKKDTLFKYSNILGNNIFLKKDAKSDWTLQNETKEINGFLCYKATSTNKIVYGEKVFNHPVTAWYCPTLPYNFGPNGYSGLPGLILELQVRNVVYGASKIELNSTETFKIETNKMKILNEKEFEEALNKLNDF